MLLAGPISHTSMDFVEILNASRDLSTIYFVHFSWCRAFFVYGCYGSYSILECYKLFSGVKLSIRSLCFIKVVCITRYLTFIQLL